VVLNPPQSPAPPNSLTGAVYYVFTGPVPDKYQFNASGNSGVATPGSTANEGEAAPGGNVFTYTYQTTGANTFSLRVQFKPDRWDEYDLTFSSATTGPAVRREFKNSALNRTDGGPFSIARSN
jgi:hypothetical protein